MRELHGSTAFEFYWILDLEELYSREGQLTDLSCGPTQRVHKTRVLKFKNVDLQCLLVIEKQTSNLKHLNFLR